jgi:HEAT repeat protein
MTREEGGGRREERIARVVLPLLLAASLSACVREGNAQSAAAAIVRDDTASVARLLQSVRGADPLFCELVTRSVDTHGWWSRWGPLSSDPLQVDSASGALIAWIQREHNDPAVVPRLRSALRDQDACVRRVAGSFLGRVEHASATAALVAALDDASADTRYVATLGLGLSDDSPRPAGVVEPLVRRLRDDSPQVRRAAAWALGALEAREALTALIGVLERDSDPRVRQAAAWALGQLKS